MGGSELAEQRDRPDPSRDVYWIKTHGGIGDVIWLAGLKLINLPLPLHISISNESRSRPRRSADLVRHLPNVVSWNYDTTSFCPESGQDWPQPNDPCCAIGKTFAELNIQPNVKTRLSCNRWLESGRRIEDWLPDIPTSHHFEFRPCGPPTLELQRPYVIMHLAGWPDVPDSTWVSAIDLLRAKCHVYIIGGSYDHRPRKIYESSRRCMPGVSLIEDTSWENMIGLLKSCEFCFGHASGFTALADVLKVKGVVYNPRAVSGLIGTWNSRENEGLVHVDRLSNFESAIGAAYRSMEETGRTTWPISAKSGPRIMLDGKDAGTLDAQAVRGACMSGVRGALVWSLSAEAPDDIPAAVLAGSYNGGKPVRRLDIVGFEVAALTKVYLQSARSTIRPSVEVYDFWPVPECDPYDLVVLYTAINPSRSAQAVRQAWGRISSHGTLLVGGGYSRVAVESLSATLKAVAAPVEGADDWWYLHRRG